MPSLPDLADGDDQIAGGQRIVVHRLRYWRTAPARSGRYWRPAARPRSAPAPDCRCSGPAPVSRMSKWASSVISPTCGPAARRAHARPAASPHYCRRPAGSARAPATLAATASRIGAVACSMRQAGNVDIAMVARSAPTARARSRHRSGPIRLKVARSSAGAWSQRPASPTPRPAARRPARPARRRRAHSRSARLGQPLMALTLASAAA